jgi:hypothetical protein
VASCRSIGSINERNGGLESHDKHEQRRDITQIAKMLAISRISRESADQKVQRTVFSWAWNSSIDRGSFQSKPSKMRCRQNGQKTSDAHIQARKSEWHGAALCSCACSKKRAPICRKASQTTWRVWAAGMVEVVISDLCVCRKLLLYTDWLALRRLPKLQRRGTSVDARFKRLNRGKMKSLRVNHVDCINGSTRLVENAISDI